MILKNLKKKTVYEGKVSTSGNPRYARYCVE